MAENDQRPKSALKTELLPHQQRVVGRLQRPDQPGLVVAHGLGSGKTLTSIAAQEALGMPSTVVAPAALLENYKKERALHLEGHRQPAKLQSMQGAALKGSVSSNPLMIVDEAHRARDTSTKIHKALSENSAEKRLLLTGSPFYNHPSDIAPLINIAAGEQLLPSDRSLFAKKYIKDLEKKPGLWGRLVRGETPGTVSVLNQDKAEELRGLMGKWVDYHPGSNENFPSVEHETVRVPMEQKQLELYDTLMGKAPAWVAAKIRSGLPPSKQEAKQLNSFLTGTRQASNTTSPFHETGEAYSPKIQRAFEEMQKTLQGNERAKGVVYSNYLDAGINPYKQRLEQAKIPYGEFTGELPADKRNELVKQYNDNKLRVLLLSSAGGEGLDLKGTRLLQMLEPHWNDEKLKQVEGRGARYKSHEGLPPEEQKLLVQRFLSTRPASGILERIGLREPGHSVDEYLDTMSTNKTKLIDQFRGLLPQEKKAGATILPDSTGSFVGKVGGGDRKTHEEGLDTSISKGTDGTTETTEDQRKLAAGLVSRMLGGAVLGALGGAGYHGFKEMTPSGIPDPGAWLQSGNMSSNERSPMTGSHPSEVLRWLRLNQGKEKIPLRRGSFVVGHLKGRHADPSKFPEGTQFDSRPLRGNVWGDASKFDLMPLADEVVNKQTSFEPGAREELQALIAEAQKPWWKRKTAEQDNPMKKIAISFPSFAGMRQGLNAAAGKMSPTFAKPVGQVAQQAAGAVKNEVSNLAQNVHSALPRDMSHVTPGHVAEGIGKHLMGKLPQGQTPLLQKAMGAIPKVMNAGTNMALGVPKLADLEKAAFVDELAAIGLISEDNAQTVSSSVEEKTAGPSKWLAEKASRLPGYIHGKLQLPEGVDPSSVLSGTNRARQLIMGHRAKALHQAYLDASPGQMKEDLLKNLIDEGTSVAKTRAALGTAGTAAYLGAGHLVTKGVGKARDFAFSQAGGDASGKQEGIDHLPKEEQGKIMLDRLGLQEGGMGRRVAERFMNPEYTNKLTIGDVISPVGAVQLGALGSLAAKPAMEHLLGAQTFFHGTPHAENVASTGLDPGLGGVPGGATHHVRSVAEKKLKLENRAAAIRKGVDRFNKRNPEGNSFLRNKAKWALEDAERAARLAESPTVNIPSIGAVPVDTANFKSNAVGRSYVGEGSMGKATALSYGQKLDPQGLERVVAPLGAIGKDGKAGVLDVLRAARASAKNFGEWGDKNVVHGVMPHEQFHNLMERDPDDIALGGSGMRTKTPVKPYDLNLPLPEGMRHPAFPSSGSVRNVRSSGVISPEHLGVGTNISAKEIFKNRSKNLPKYVTQNPGRFAKGLGLAGAGLGAAYLGAKPVYTAAKKLLSKKEEKTAAISDEQAAKALERYEALEKTHPTPGQVARYSALGAVTAPVASLLTSAVSGQPVFGGGGFKQRLRGAAGVALGGALGMGVMPLLRQHLDRRAEMDTLKSYMEQPHAMQDTSANAAGKLSAPFEPVEKAAAEEKTAFEVSQYSGPMGPVFFRQQSQVPPMRVPSLRSPVQKTAESAITPSGRLASTTQVGLPKLTAPAGPSIAQVAKPVGFGKPLPGANKGSI